MKVGPAVVLAFSIFCLLILAGPAHADSVATIVLNASLIPSAPSNGVFAQFPASGPSFYVTGQFTLDETTSTILSWNIFFLGPLGVTGQLSVQNGGVATAICDGQCPNEPSGPGWWDFVFNQGTDSVDFDTLYRDPNSPFYTGEILDLCALIETFYSDGGVGYAPGCAGTSDATLNNQYGAVYELESGTSSGTLTVVSVMSTPEPAASMMLLLGIATIFGMRRFSRRKVAKES